MKNNPLFFVVPVEMDHEVLVRDQMYSKKCGKFKPTNSSIRPAIFSASLH
jgi:hypothetical protein